MGPLTVRQRARYDDTSKGKEPMTYELQLEAASSQDDVLKGYDRDADRWSFSRDSDFWRAVRHAHELGYRGRGRRVAIIDSGCDVSIPRLARQIGIVRNLVSQAPGLKHGTAVALLISEVAPECTLDIYNVVSEDGLVDESATIRAISEAAQSEAMVINLSLGKARELVPDDKHGHATGSCALCDAASKAAASGKLVFAAVGNDMLHSYCPAIAPSVVAVGFQRLVKANPTPDTEVVTMAPLFTQAIYADLMLLGVEGVLGSSFACPLYAGVAALGLGQGELWRFIESYKARVWPMRTHSQLDTAGGGVANGSADLLRQIDEGYWRTLSLIPHSHSDLQSSLDSKLPRSDPGGCPFCGIFADLQYINLGYWLFSTGRAAQAIDLLEAARELCPWDAKPFAIHGSASFQIGQVDQAIRSYEVAVRMSPDNRRYADALAMIRLHAGQAIGPFGVKDIALHPDLVDMTHFDRTRWRLVVVRRMNLLYYLVTLGLAWLHLAVPSSALLKWALLLPVLVGLRFSAGSLRDASVSSLQSVAIPDYPTRRIVRSFTRLCIASATGYLCSAIVLILLLVVT